MGEKEDRAAREAKKDADRAEEKSAIAERDAAEAKVREAKEKRSQDEA